MLTHLPLGYIYIYIYRLTKEKNKDTPTVCSEAFRPILFNELHGEEQNTAKTTWHIYTQANQTNPLAHVNITPTPEVFTCKTRQGDASSITSSYKDNMFSQ